MTKTKLFKNAGILLFTLAFLQALEIKFYLSWALGWYDMMLHTLGGIVVGMVAILLMRRYLTIDNYSKAKIYLMTICFALIIGIIWEILELSLGITAFSDGMAYITDTSSDLLLDLLGSLIGAYYANRL